MSLADPGSTGWLVALLVIVALVGLGTGVAIAPTLRRRALTRRRAAARANAPEQEPTSDGHQRRAAVVVNPTKFDDLEAVRQRVTSVCGQAGWAEPLWLETTADDVGHGQTRQALDEGVDLVCPLGGDGTVRVVAQTLAGTDTPLGLLPGGTGNLLARNLALPVDDLEEALRVALTGHDKRIDVGRIRVDAGGGPQELPDSEGDEVDRPDEQPAEHVFLVMAGLGFDAEMMAGAPEGMKARMGWLAYAVSGVRALRGEQTKVRVKVGEDEEFTRRVRTVVIGNVGKLTGGIMLLPDAKPDDGWLDAVTLSPKGVVSWAVVAGRVLTRNKRFHRRVEHFRCRRIEIVCDRPTETQLDGDVIGRARSIEVWVDPDALLVRMP